jgi:transposase
MAESLHDHYRRLLGLQTPWEVSDVKLDLAQQRVQIRLNWIEGYQQGNCPECGKSVRLYDLAPERRWRHLDTMQFETLLITRTPRIQCPEHGIKTVTVPWAGKNSRFTLMLEAFAIALLEGSATIKEAAKLLKMDWHSVHQIMERAVSRGLERRDQEAIRHLGLDEKGFGRGHSYVTVLTDLSAGRVLEVVPERTQEAAESTLESLSQTQRQAVQAVAADMWQPYAQAVQKLAPEAALVHDKFHVAKLIHEALDQVRRQEHRALGGGKNSPLTKSKYLWLRNPLDFNPEQKEHFDTLRQSELKTARAWHLKQTFANFWFLHAQGAARKFFARWYNWAVRSRLRPMAQVARKLKSHLQGLLNYFCHRISNAPTEGLDSKIQFLKHAARGFRTFHNYRTRILFFCGKLDLYPILH